MLTEKQKDKLKSNWGEKADSLQCLAEVRIYDPCSNWQCYIYAMNPENEDEIKCIIEGFIVSIEEKWQMSSIENLYNSNGESVKIDEEYRPKRADEVFKNLCNMSRYKYERSGY